MITLQILSNDDAYQFIFHDTSRGVVSAFPAIIEKETRWTVTGPYRNAASPRGVSTGDFNTAGNMIFSLFPAQVKQRLLNDRNCAILIQTNDTSIPWELSHDGDEFLGLSRPLGRMIVTEVRLGGKSRIAKQGSRLSVLIIANPERDKPDRDLPEADTEAKNLDEFLTQQGCLVTVLAGEAANRFDVMKHLLSPYDIIHFAGHAVLAKTGN